MKRLLKRVKYKKSIVTVLLVTGLLLGSSVFTQETFVKGFESSITADFTYTSATGESYTGQLYYESPGKLHVKLSDNKVIATNGKFLWVYNPETMTCAKQTVGEPGGGIQRLLKEEYLVESTEDKVSYVYPHGAIKEMVIEHSNGDLKNIRLNVLDNWITMSFSNIQIGAGIKGTLFNYRPPTDAQVVENPLNSIGALVQERVLTQKEE